MKFRDVRVSFNFGVGQFRDTIGENDRSVKKRGNRGRYDIKLSSVYDVWRFFL